MARRRGAQLVDAGTGQAWTLAMTDQTMGQVVYWLDLEATRRETYKRKKADDLPIAAALRDVIDQITAQWLPMPEDDA